jgi:hypothetical protein
MGKSDEATALAMLRSGRSYDEASRLTGVSVARCMELVPMPERKTP